MASNRQATVVAVKDVSSKTPKEEWMEDRLLPGDIVEEVASAESGVISAPFAGGKTGLEDELRQMFRTTDVISVSVRRGHTVTDLRACVVSEESVMPKKHYTLRSFNDTRHVVVLVDSSEDECLKWQESTRKVLKGSMKQRQSVALSNAKHKDHLLPYPWKPKMQSFLPVESSPMVFSLILMPYQPSRDRPACKDVEDTSARAMAWLSSAQASGVPIIFVNIQTELIFKERNSKEVNFFCSANKDMIQSLTNSGRFKVPAQDTPFLDVARAIRLWYVPAAAEVAVDLKPNTGEKKLGIGLACNEEGFCYVSSIEDRSAADRAGLQMLLEGARSARKLLVISRVGGAKVTPWMVSSSGSIHCYDAVGMREQLSLHRVSQLQVQIHVMVWDGNNGTPMSESDISFPPTPSAPATGTPAATPTPTPTTMEESSTMWKDFAEAAAKNVFA